MLRTIMRLEKLASLRGRYLREGKLSGSTAAQYGAHAGDDEAADGDGDGDGDAGHEERVDDAGPEEGPQSLSSVRLAASPSKCST